MAKYAMLNCWSDLNKGDLGIMLASVAEIKKKDPNAHIIGVSCFGIHDPMFVKCHENLRKFVPDIYPAIYGVLGLFIGGKYRKELPYKFLAVILENIRFWLLMLLPKCMAKFFLTKNEKHTLAALKSCNICFSKGGSVFTDYGTQRGAFALKRLCRLYSLLHKFELPYYILGQSFGPVQTQMGIKRVNRVIKNAEHVYLREMSCVEQYSNLNLSGKNISFSNDAGFLLEPQEVKPNPIDKSHINIGMTVRTMDSDIENYKESITKIICYLIEEKKYQVHIFQQVAMSDEPDNKMAQSILENLTDRCRKGVIYHTEDYLPQELAWLYGQMDAFIGTRLHSTIFSMRAGTPSLGLIYHGTKTQGVFENIGVPELVLMGPISSEELIEKFDYLWDNKEILKERIMEGVLRAQEEMQSAIRHIVEDAQRR